MGIEGPPLSTWLGVTISSFLYWAIRSPVSSSIESTDPVLASRFGSPFFESLGVEIAIGVSGLSVFGEVIGLDCSFASGEVSALAISLSEAGSMGLVEGEMSGDVIIRSSGRELIDFRNNRMVRRKNRIVGLGKIEMGI